MERPLDLEAEYNASLLRTRMRAVLSQYFGEWHLAEIACRSMFPDDPAFVKRMLSWDDDILKDYILEYIDFGKELEF